MLLITHEIVDGMSIAHLNRQVEMVTVFSSPVRGGHLYNNLERGNYALFIPHNSSRGPWIP